MKTPILTFIALFFINFCTAQSESTSDLAQVDKSEMIESNSKMNQTIINNQIQSLKFKKLVTQELSYPKEFESSGIEGTVVVEFDLLENGNIESLIVLKKLHNSFDSLVINKIKNLNTEMLSNNFQSQKKMQIPIRFVLE